MSIEGIGASKVESTPNYNPVQGPEALSNFSQGKQDKGAQTRQSTKSNDSFNLSTEAQTQVQELQQRDREVRSHEQAHVAAGGQYVRGGINYTYTRGPDNKQYAIGGSVSLDTSPIAGDSEATLEKARVVRSAALAPANPSAQDQSVAAAAAQMEAQARTEKTQEQNENQGSEQDKIDGIAGTTVADAPDQAISKSTSNSNTANENILILHNMSSNEQSSQRDIDAAHTAYKTQQRSAFIASSLAPWGTGISLQI